MKKALFCLLLLMTYLLSSCGLGGDSMKPSQVKISGPLGKYFEVIDREYKVKDGEINVEIKRIKEGLPAPWEEDMELGYSDGCYEPHFSIEVRNSDGDIIVKDETNIIISDDELKAIMALGIDESASIHFDVDEEGGSSFKIGSTFKVNGERKVSTSDDEEDSFTNADANNSSDNIHSYSSDNMDDETSFDYDSDSEDWDNILDSYERFVDKYHVMLKKAQSGDMSAMEEYPSLLEEAQEYAEKLKKASGMLSPSQASRFQSILNKAMRTE